MLITMIATVKIPRNEDDEHDSAALRLYHWVWIMHLAMAVTLFLNYYCSNALGVVKYTLNACMVLF